MQKREEKNDENVVQVIDEIQPRENTNLPEISGVWLLVYNKGG